MRRPCFLVIDREFPGSISTRKLVIETAKLNVITAYDPDEGVETLKRFPNVDGVVFDAQLEGVECSELAERLRAVRTDVPIIITSAGAIERCGPGANYLETHNPGHLLDFLRSLCQQVAKDAMKREHSYSEGTNQKAS